VPLPAALIAEAKKAWATQIKTADGKPVWHEYAFRELASHDLGS
jgi:hypothetical protein